MARARAAGVTPRFMVGVVMFHGALAGALEGASASLGEDDYAARVRQAMGGEVELFGSSPEALATAVVRALLQPVTEDVSRDA